MPAIRCKACGKTYDSREGFCPKCGAYNRPPRQEWVDAGGDVHYAEQEKVCYEQKECHEEKVCYENQTRRPRPHIRRPAVRKNPSSAATFIAVAVVVIVLFAVLRGCIFYNLAPITPDYPDYDDGWAAVGPSEDACSDRQYVSEGESFTLEDSAFVVAYTELNHENLSLLAYVVEEGDYQTFPDLIWVDDDGFEMWVPVDDVTASAEGDGVFLCTYDLDSADVDLTSDIYLVFEDDYTSVWVPIPLSA